MNPTTRESPPRPPDAVILDLDGVITDTAAVHARAWKRIFDAFLDQRDDAEGEDHRPFDLDSDYRTYVDGKPRYDGARSFLQSRGIELPDGDPDDPPSFETICGIGNRKNDAFREVLKAEGVTVFDDALACVPAWRRAGMPLAVASSSRNCRDVIVAGGIEHIFDARVDGGTLAQLDLPGKPAPDMFTEAARRLGVEPARAAVVEDAISGVEAGVAGGFDLVVGIARTAGRSQLEHAGAHVVVERLTDLSDRLGFRDLRPVAPSAPKHYDEISRRLADADPFFFLDYDGTLTPIVAQPEDAVLSDDMRQTLTRLASASRVAVISGRDLRDVRARVGLDGIIYAGSHGFDIEGPNDLRLEHESATGALAELDRAEEALHEALDSIPGARIERKRFAIAVHFRNVDEADVESVRDAAIDVASRFDALRWTGGKAIVELRPDIDWDKGCAVRWLLDRLGGEPLDTVPVYVGDDLTDEDAFRALAGRGITIHVGDEPLTTAAYRLGGVDELRELIERVVHDLEVAAK